MREGSMIRLRAWQESDLPTMTRLRNDAALQAQLLSRARGSNESDVRQWLEKRAAGVDSLLWIIADRDSNKPLGYLQFIEIDPVDHRADLGICLIPEAQGKGTGSEAIRLALSYIHDTWAIRKVSLRTLADNHAAINCYQQIGFKECGLLREHVFSRGVWKDVVLMEIFLAPRNT